MFVYGLSGCGFESRCCHLNLRYGTCLVQGGKLWSGFSLKLLHDTIIKYNQYVDGRFSGKWVLNQIKAQEVIFSRKSKAISHPTLVFNNDNVIQATYQKHFGIVLDNRLSFEKHLERVLFKIKKTIDHNRKLQYLLPRSAQIKLHKAFIYTHLDYGDILYVQARNALFHPKLKYLQRNICLAATGAIRVS